LALKVTGCGYISKTTEGLIFMGHPVD